MDNLSVNTSSLDEADDPDEFYFESDHLALKGNKDYLLLLKTLAILQSQRARALQDLDVIQKVRQRALGNPEEFIAILKAGGDLGVPNRQIIAEVPHIEWNDYNATIPTSSNLANTRQPGNACTSSKSKTQDKEGKLTVRGRTFDESKPETFNQLWTADEQRRLEELLIEYPPEEIESRRFQKIAEALGNRTRMQVSSRVQKYFLKLMKAGLPIPGRVPKQNPELLKKGGSHSRQRASHFLSRPTTFFPQHQDLPVYMPEGDLEEVTANEGPVIIKSEPLDDCTIEQRRLNLLRRIREEKTDANLNQQCHYGFKCNNCDEEPIIGTRWHCLNCVSPSANFCSDCVVMLLDSGDFHLTNHLFEAAHSAEPACDPDYMPHSFSKTYNYLDPNFLPH